MSESLQGAGHETSKEANKNVAKDSDAGITTRASAAKDALKDKKDEEKHDAKADAHKGKQAYPLSCRFRIANTHTASQKPLSTEISNAMQPIDIWTLVL